MTFFPITQIDSSDPSLFDSYARLRVSNSMVLFNSKQLRDGSPLVWATKTVSGGRPPMFKIGLVHN